MEAQRPQIYWARVLLTGVLIVTLVIIFNVVLPVLVSHIWSQPNQAQIAMQLSSWGTYILLFLLTGGGAVWVARKGEREPQLHGLLVGLVAALILLFLRLGFGSPLLVALVTFVLMLAAGFIGGILGGRGREKPTSP